MKNLPDRNEKSKFVVCEQRGDKYLFINSDNYIIEEVRMNDLSGLARLLEDARNIGYNQALKTIRQTLGINR